MFAFGNKDCLDPNKLYAQCVERELPVDHWFGLANTYRVNSGATPDRGLLLLTEHDLFAIPTQYAQALEIYDQFGNLARSTLLYVVKRTRVIGGADNDPENVWLVEVADVRCRLRRMGVSAAYNLWKDDGSGYHAVTLNAGVPWTWAQIATSLWAAVVGLGTFPGLPFTPHGTPANFNYHGTYALDSLCNFLNRIGCELIRNPTDGTFAIVQQGGGASNYFAAWTGKEAVFDARVSAPAPANRPEKVRVRFRILPAPIDGSSPFYLIDVALPAVTGVLGSSVVILDDDLPALGSVPSNLSTLNSRANERAADWVRKFDYLDQPTDIVYRETFGGAARAVGERRTGVVWEERGAGHHTEAFSEPNLSLERWRSTGFSALPLPTSLTTLNTDATHLVSPTHLIAADPTTGISFDSTYAGAADTRLFNYPVTVTNWGVLNTDTVFPQEWIGNKGARDTPAASTFPGGVGYQVYSQVWNGNAGSGKRGAKAAVNVGRVPFPTGAGDIAKVSALLQLVSWGASGNGPVTTVIAGPTLAGMVFTSVAAGADPTPPDDSSIVYSTLGIGTWYLSSGWHVQVASQTIWSAFSLGGTGPSCGITYYDSGVTSSVAGTLGAARHLNTGGGSGRWADTTILAVLAADGHLILEGAVALNLRFGVERTGGPRMGGDAIFDVMTSTTQKYRLSFYGGLFHWFEVISGISPPPPPPPPPGTGQLVVTVVDKAGAPLAGRSVVTSHGSGTTNAAGQVVFTGVAPGGGTSTVTLLAGESCRSSASWPGGSNLSNFNSIPYEIIASSTTEVGHQIFADAVRFSSTTGDLTVLLGDQEVTANTVVRTPAAASAMIPGTFNNYALPTDFKGRTIYLSSTGGASTITGISATGVADGTRVRIILNSASGNITVNHADTGSTAANRVLISGGVNATYAADDGFELEYDATAARWRIPY